MTQEAGQLIAKKYRLERRLARGGMGAVWVARHLDLDVEVALKFSRMGEDLDSQSEDRFRREARAAARLKSPHIVQIHDYGLEQGVPYIAMELLAGRDLGEILTARGRVPLSQALSWIAQAGKALKIVHQAGIVHRDIKPSNLFLAEQGGDSLLKMLDFGIAKSNKDPGQTTTAGLLLGSPAYMSPEQARGNVVDERSDLWSLGAVFYRMLTGTAPFEGSSSGDILVRLCTEDVVPPSQIVPSLPTDVNAFFHRALARNPEQRFASVDEFLQAASALSPGHIDPLPSVDIPLSDASHPLRGRTSDTASLRQTPIPREAENGNSTQPVAPEPSRISHPVEITQPSPSHDTPPRPHSPTLMVLGAVLLLGTLALFWSGQPKPHPSEVPDAADVVQGANPFELTETLERDLRATPQENETAGSRKHAENDTEASPEPRPAPPEPRDDPTTPPPPSSDQSRSARSRSGPQPSQRPSTSRPSAPNPPPKAPSRIVADPVFGLPLEDTP